MKAVLIFGSPRKNGHTAQLLDAFVSAMPDGTEYEYFDACGLSVQPCTGCGACEDRWFCPLNDDMERVLEAIVACDVLVIASPVYFLTFPAPLKALVDRTQRCFAAQERGMESSPFSAKQRAAVVLLTAGSPPEKGEVVAQQLRWLLPPLNARLAGMTVCADTDRAGVTAEAREQARTLARGLNK